ncbi:MAG: disulfide bond formation protein B [bacterium]|nr:disulfide bond formation protein B [bacterium]
MELAAFMNGLWSIMAIVAQVLVLFGIIALVSPRVRRTAPAQFMGKWGVWIAFIAATLATVGSLIYSDIIGYDPCKLCWIQRIFMYPTAIVLGLALWKRDASARLYGIVFSSLGAIVAAYHYVSQLGWNPLDLECASVGYSVSCAKVFVMEFGYITLPVMALSAFLLAIVSLSLNREWPIR